MNKKITKRINGGFAIYYGISALIGAFFCIIGLIRVLFKIWSGQSEFTWWTPLGITVIGVILGAIGYAILRVGYEEIEK